MTTPQSTTFLHCKIVKNLNKLIQAYCGIIFVQYSSVSRVKDVSLFYFLIPRRKPHPAVPKSHCREASHVWSGSLGKINP